MLKNRKVGDLRYRNIKKEISHEEYYFASVDDEDFKGVFLAFNLSILDTKKYFGYDYNFLNDDELISLIKDILSSYEFSLEVIDGYLSITIPNENLDNLLTYCNDILKSIRDYYSKYAIHITRMFGSYILLKQEDGQLKAIKATPIPIKYCPLMIKLLKEVGGDVAQELIDNLAHADIERQEELMCKLINQVVIEGGYFDTNRPLNSCEANVLFGASETIYSAFNSNMIDAAVIVSNNLGTIITTNAESTQGAVKRMTGLFYTSPNEEISKTARDASIIQVFPYTATIDQLEGVMKSISLGYKRIAVTLAASDNLLHKKLSEIEEKYNVVIYKFGLCSTGIDYETALSMMEHADIIWSCASKYVKELIEPNAIAQVGIKIPVHIMTVKGYDIVSNHLNFIDEVGDIPILKGDDKRVLVHDHEKIKVLTKKEIHKCSDCPHPCI